MNVTVKGQKYRRRRSLRCTPAIRSMVLIIVLWCGVVAVVVMTVFARSRWARLRRAGGLRGERATSKHISAGSTVTPSLDPIGAVIGGVELFWLVLPRRDETKGILVHFHGCNHGGHDFFKLPEDRVVAKEALLRGLAVLSITSKDRESGCWGEEDAVLLKKQATIKTWAKKVGLKEDTPIIGLGASSGAAFLFDAWKFVGFKAMASYIIRRGFEKEDIGRGHNGNDKAIPLPPTAFVHMPRDKATAAAVRENSDALVSAGIPTLVVEVDPHPFTTERCSERLPELGDRRCVSLIEKLKEYPDMFDPINLMVKKNTWGENDDWNKVFLSAGLDDALRDHVLSDDKVVRGKVPTRSFNGHSWLWAAVDEEINVAFGMHEMVSEKSGQVLDWLMEQAGLS